MTCPENTKNDQLASGIRLVWRTKDNGLRTARLEKAENHLETGLRVSLCKPASSSTLVSPDSLATGPGRAAKLRSTRLEKADNHFEIDLRAFLCKPAGQWQVLPFGSGLMDSPCLLAVFPLPLAP